MRQGMVSIIVLNWNGLGFTKQCIKSVREKTSYKPYEIIVVDNGSKASEVAALKKMHISGKIDRLFLNSCNQGFSGGNNIGIRAAKGQYFLLLNNDTEVTKNWLGLLVSLAEKDAKTGIVGPNVVLPGEETIFGGGYVDNSGAARHSFNAMESRVEQVGGAALFFKRDLFEKIGGLDEGFNPIYFEETDFCTRARRAGFNVVFTPKSKVIHFEGGIMKKQPSRGQFVTINKNRLRYMLLHFPKARLVKAVPWEAMRLGKSIALLRPHWLLQAYWACLRQLPEIWEKRQKYKKGELRA